MVIIGTRNNKGILLLWLNGNVKWLECWLLRNKTHLSGIGCEDKNFKLQQTREEQTVIRFYRFATDIWLCYEEGSVAGVSEMFAVDFWLVECGRKVVIGKKMVGSVYIFNEWKGIKFWIYKGVFYSC